MTKTSEINFLLVFLSVLLFLGIVGDAVAQSPQDAPMFTDITARSGPDFTHFNGMQGKLLLPEIMGSGVAFLDYDNDGDLDVFLVQGSSLDPEDDPGKAIYPWNSKKPPQSKLFRNDLKDGTPSFVDVTARSGIDARGYGIGVAVADVNNDGWDDIYVLNLGKNKLFINNRKGSFLDKTEEYGVGDPGWSVGASFFDFDKDGFADLYVVNYAVFNGDSSPKCYSISTARDYCGPSSFKPAPNRLFRNVGGKKFEDVSSSSGILADTGHSLGVIAADIDGDSWTDLYVANDGDPNNLFINKKNGKFEDDAFFSGAAVNAKGQSEASMGVDAGDFNGDGKLDLFVTHIMEETHTLYSNGGNAIFEDVTLKTGLNRPDFRLTGFGTLFFDFDNDGDLDLFVANGAVKLLKEVVRPGNRATLDPKYPLGQLNQLFRRENDGSYADISAMSGAPFSDFSVSRGATFGDVDNDGDTDILVSNNSGKAMLMRNDAGSSNNWLGVKVRHGKSKSNLLGTVLRIKLDNGAELIRRVRTDGSYASAHDPRVIIGLGKNRRIKSISVGWPDGAQETFKTDAANKYIDLIRGAGSEE